MQFGSREQPFGTAASGLNMYHVRETQKPLQYHPPGAPFASGPPPLFADEGWGYHGSPASPPSLMPVIPRNGSNRLESPGEASTGYESSSTTHPSLLSSPEESSTFGPRLSASEGTANGGGPRGGSSSSQCESTSSLGGGGEMHSARGYSRNEQQHLAPNGSQHAPPHQHGMRTQSSYSSNVQYDGGAGAIQSSYLVNGNGVVAPPGGHGTSRPSTQHPHMARPLSGHSRVHPGRMASSFGSTHFQEDVAPHNGRGGVPADIGTLPGALPGGVETPHHPRYLGDYNDVVRAVHRGRALNAGMAQHRASMAPSRSIATPSQQQQSRHYAEPGLSRGTHGLGHNMDSGVLRERIDGFSASGVDVLKSGPHGIRIGGASGAAMYGMHRSQAQHVQRVSSDLLLADERQGHGQQPRRGGSPGASHDMMISSRMAMGERMNGGPPYLPSSRTMMAYNHTSQDAMFAGSGCRGGLPSNYGSEPREQQHQPGLDNMSSAIALMIPSATTTTTTIATSRGGTTGGVAGYTLQVQGNRASAGCMMQQQHHQQQQQSFSGYEREMSGRGWARPGTRAMDAAYGGAQGMPQKRTRSPPMQPGQVARRGKIVTAASNGQLYKTKLCYYHVHGTCSWGDSCHHAHSLEELKLKPDLSKTSICPRLGDCKRKDCPYAHSRDELRSTECFAKTKVCFGSCENCRFGGNCRYAHSVTELRQVKDLPVKVMANIKGKKKAPPLQSLKGGDAKRGIKLVHSRAKGDFDAGSYGEGYIDLFCGDRVAIVKDDEDGWMYGKNFPRNTIGWFPTSYVLDESDCGELICEPC
ncbi:unnamed protein product [Amoebophrya sp. A25]|nr:unnamed protein product [Amoebophrya sp. A25]|eukprot:GSA25T00015742001.1